MTYIGDSTAASNTYAAPPSASATSPTTSPAACSRPAASDPDYTLKCDEPEKIEAGLAKYGQTVVDAKDVKDYQTLDAKLDEYWGWVGKTRDVVAAGGTNAQVQETMAKYTALYGEIEKLMKDMIAANADHVGVGVDGVSPRSTRAGRPCARRSSSRRR